MDASKFYPDARRAPRLKRISAALRNWRAFGSPWQVVRFIFHVIRRG